MNEIKTLLENFWVLKDTDKETYYRVKRDIPLFQKFVREQLGWKLIHTERLIKLEKIPAHAESFMGIQEFREIRDYALLCVILMFLEDKEEQEQFLLSELIHYVETCLKQYMEIDWTSYTQRKSLVRVLQYMERMQMLKVYDGSSEDFGQEAGQEVLYENTGYAKYFAVTFPVDISGFASPEDFENSGLEGMDEDRGSARIHRVYRQLAVCPAMQWEEASFQDALYLKNERRWVTKYMQENLGGRLDIHENAAFWMLEEGDSFGRTHPRDAMLPEVVLLVCEEIRKRVEQSRLKREENERIFLSEREFASLVDDCQNAWKNAWTKEYREMDSEKLRENIKNYMIRWMMLRQLDGGLAIEPAAGKLCAEYPADFRQ